MTEDEKDSVRIRMHELMFPVEQQIMMCDSREELLMMACAMMQRSAEIIDSQISRKARSRLFMDMV